MKFEELEVWKNSMRLAKEVYESTARCRDNGFNDQIRRASVSIPSNIAEGFERETNKEFIRYLYIARGSCGEVRTQLYLGLSIGHFESSVANPMIEQTKTISAQITALIKRRREWDSVKEPCEQEYIID